ncbi:hypothetical protein [Halovivax gelatinilyticus]|uniref:hypothetical protein n=1 Tax=Halovivax gelatinilyticus TaxID=2961597 RepID=UPI0020CA6D5E|nr:hypothetical protein [Halovivax gelatinilyticus]
MVRSKLLAMVVVVSLLGGALVAWSGVLIANREVWLPKAIGYVTLGIIALGLLLSVWTLLDARGEV